MSSLTTHIQRTSFGVYNLLRNTTFQYPNVWLCLFCPGKILRHRRWITACFGFFYWKRSAQQQHKHNLSSGQKDKVWQCCLVDGTSLDGGVSTGKRNYCHSCLAWTSTQSHVEEEQEKCSIRVKREQRHCFIFPMALRGLLLNNEMKISLRHPTTLVQSIQHQDALQPTFNSLKMEFTFLFYSLGNSRCL